MLHYPAGNVDGVGRDLCAGIEWIVLQFLPPFRTSLLLCGHRFLMFGLIDSLLFFGE